MTWARGVVMKMTYYPSSWKCEIISKIAKWKKNKIVTSGGFRGVALGSCAVVHPPPHPTPGQDQHNFVELFEIFKTRSSLSKLVQRFKSYGFLIFLPMVCQNWLRIRHLKLAIDWNFLGGGPPTPPFGWGFFFHTHSLLSPTLPTTAEYTTSWSRGHNLPKPLALK